MLGRGTIIQGLARKCGAFLFLLPITFLEKIAPTWRRHFPIAQTKKTRLHAVFAEHVR